jgi:hypothetical protein
MRATQGWWVLVGAVSVLVAVAACRHDEPVPPTRLADGTRARISTIPFEGLGSPVVLTSASRARAPACALPRSGALRVERVGVRGRSITVVSLDRQWVWACDSTVSHRSCGQAFGRLRPQGLTDPRLSLTCRDAGGMPLGFAWVEPTPTTAFVVVEQDGYAEAYPVLRQTPVRVTTSNVDVATSSARARYSLHARDGGVVGSGTLDAQVSD